MPWLFKQTLIFEGPGHGWTESLYFERDSDDVQAAIDATVDYRNKRRPLLGKECSIIGQRTLVVQDLAGLVVKRVGLTNKFSPSLPGTQSQPAEDTGTSLLVVWSDPTSRLKKPMYMGGAWAEIFPNANNYVPAGGWQGFYNSWRQYCIDKRFGWRHRLVANSYTITGYTIDPVTFICTYTLRSGASIFASFGERRTVGVEFAGKRHALDGMQVVVPLDETAPVAPATDWITRVKSATARPAFAFNTPGQMRLYTSTFVTPAPGAPQGAVGGINPEKPVGRKRGRPLLTSPGRLPNRIRA